MQGAIQVLGFTFFLHSDDTEVWQSLRDFLQMLECGKVTLVALIC